MMRRPSGNSMAPTVGSEGTEAERCPRLSVRCRLSSKLLRDQAACAGAEGPDVRFGGAGGDLTAWLEDEPLTAHFDVLPGGVRHFLRCPLEQDC